MRPSSTLFKASRPAGQQGWAGRLRTLERSLQRGAALHIWFPEPTQSAHCPAEGLVVAKSLPECSPMTRALALALYRGLLKWSRTHTGIPVGLRAGDLYAVAPLAQALPDLELDDSSTVERLARMSFKLDRRLQVCGRWRCEDGAPASGQLPDLREQSL